MLCVALAIALLSSSVLSACAGQQVQKPNQASVDTFPRSQIRPSNETTIDASVFITLCAKEKSVENRIYFRYPQFKETTANAEALNELIVEYVDSEVQKACQGGFKGEIKGSPEDWKWNNDEYQLQAMNIGYTIRRNDADYFSVTFDGLYNRRKAAHPYKYFSSLTIDVREGKVVTLSDLYHIDTRFVELLRNKFKEQFQARVIERGGSIADASELGIEAFPKLDDATLVKALRQTDEESDSFGFDSFITNTSVGISVDIGFALGGHFAVMISYDELKPFAK